MADRITKEKRSALMASVKSRGNKTTEGRMVELFRENKITGWRRHNKRIHGTPDFSFSKQKLAIFVDGCFWHGGKKCYTPPKTNVEFWEKKVEANIKRDRRNKVLLELSGWKHVRIWEHQIKKDPNKVLQRIQRLL
ncbi:MAG: very short patch repair endonuclease [Candidatus Nomurabacteria bacterium]|nr:very short patch repair endonuclease [Candidatus Nomurabacteria bacterium]